MAQGYVVAQDRLWQMDFYRRVGAGRLSEVLGDATLDTDRFVRTVGWRRAAREGTGRPARRRYQAILQAYADGVNAFIDSHHDALPLEFTILGYKPDPWTPLDTLTFGKVMAWDLQRQHGQRADAGRSAGQARRRASGAAAARLSRRRADHRRSQSALPGNPLGRAPGPLRLQRRVRLPMGVRPHRQQQLGGGRHAQPPTASPLLANDPHLGVQNPSIWYAMHLRAERRQLRRRGVTFAGAPGIVIGHNRDIAWGVTNLGPDTQDLYVETLDPAGHPGQYQYQGQWLPLDVLTETINVKGAAGAPLTVTCTATARC